MDFANLILNIVALLLWLSWRWMRFDPVRGTPASLAGTLKRAEPSRLRGWHLLACLVALLVCRALVYSWIGPSANWTPSLRVGGISIPFRSDVGASFMLLYSAFSFALTLGVFYLCLLLLSVLDSATAEGEPLRKLVRMHLGWLDGWPRLIKVVVPLLLVLVSWLLTSLLFAELKIIPAPKSELHRLEQGLVLGLGSYLECKYFVVGVLCLYVLGSYVYFGNQSFWNLVTVTGRNLLLPLRAIPLQFGKVDFAPILGIALVLLGAFYADRGLVALYARLPIR